MDSRRVRRLWGVIRLKQRKAREAAYLPRLPTPLAHQYFEHRVSRISVIQREPRFAKPGVAKVWLEQLIQLRIVDIREAATGCKRRFGHIDLHRMGTSHHSGSFHRGQNVQACIRSYWQKYLYIRPSKALAEQ